MRIQPKIEDKLYNQPREAIGQLPREIMYEISDLLTVISLNVDLIKDEIREVEHGIPTEAKIRVCTIMGKVDKVTRLTKQHLLS